MLPILAAPPSAAAAATRVYYSVGTSAADLKAGTPTVTITAGIATFSAAQPDNVGVGDQVTYNGATIAYISGRTSSTQYKLTTATGTTPANIAGATVNSIRRAFASLTVAEANSSNGSHLATANLVGANIQLNWPCYNDGVLTDSLRINGYTTGPANYIRVYTPTSSNEVGVSQRHRGGFGTGFQLNGTANAVAIQIDDEYVRVEGLVVQHTVTNNSAVWAVWSDPALTTSDVRISHNIVKGVITGGVTGGPSGIEVGTAGAGQVFRVWDNVVYNFNTTNGVGISLDNGIAYVFNNTVFNCFIGVWKSSGVTGQVRNNVSINDALNASFTDYVNLAGPPAVTQSNNVSSDATATGTGSQTGRAAYSGYFKNTTSGTEDFHLRNYSLSLWGSSGADLSSDANLPVIDDIDGGLRMRPDIGADEFGACCALSTTEVTGSTITITGTSQFEMRFNAATGGGIDQLYDLVEDPTKTYDLAGGVNDLRTLHDFEIAPNGGAFSGVNHTTEDNSSGSRVDLLEATSTRVRVRQDALFQADGGTNILGGIEGFGDYSVYGSGRTAVGWTEKDWNTPLFTYARRQIGMAAHYTGSAPLNSYTPCYEGNAACNSSGAGGAAADWLLGVRNSAGARTDFLTILSQDWVQATTVEYLALSGAGQEFSDQVWQQAGAGTAASQAWNLLTYFKPTSFTAAVGPQDPAVISRSTDYRTPDSPGITTGLSWQDADENTASDNFNEAEAAYLFSLDAALGLRFTMNGSVTNRFAPFFKIRRWRAFHPPATITFDPDAGGAAPSVTLVRNVGYVADVKPLSRASFARDLLWHSTLQDAAAVTAPDVGTGGQVIGSVSFPTARYGAGAGVPGIGSYVTARVTDASSLLTGNFDKAKGAVEFWYKPDWASNDFVAHEIAGVFSAASNYFMLQKTVANNLEFRIFASSTTSNCSVAAGTLWVANQWVHLRIEWDDTAALASQQAVFLNGANLNCVPTFDYNSGNLVLGANRDFIFGDADNTDGENGTGVFDEVHIYGGSAAAPQPLAHGGLTSDTREYLRSATPARNFQYAFAPVDTTRRGRYAYFGSDSKWSGLNVYLSVPGSSAGALDLQWQFWNGTTWTTLESGFSFTDPTAHLTANGSIYWTGDPAGWKPSSVNGGPDLYYVRAYLTNASAAYTTPPTESEITTDLLLFQYCGDVTAANQEFTFAAPVATAVGLLSFSAAGADGAVELAWRTGSEVDNLGFHLHRSLAEGGPWTRVTSSLIPGQGFSATGAAYAWRDSGLQNGTRYFYRLEDVDSKSVSTFHDPVSAVPQAGATTVPLPPPPGGGGSGGGGSESGSGSGFPLSCPSWALAQLGSSASYTCEIHGDPAATSFRVLSRTSRSALVELETGGFLTARDATGRVRTLLPGFDSLSDPLAPALPLKRARLDGVVGRQARIGSIQARENRFFTGLVAAAVGYPQAVVARDGTVQPGRREAELGLSRGVFPRVQARLGGEGFQGEDKTLALELMPLRYDASRGALVLSRRLTVRVDFAGAEPSEVGRGRLGRRIRPSRSDGSAYAFLATSQKGLHSRRLRDALPGTTPAPRPRHAETHEDCGPLVARLGRRSSG